MSARSNHADRARKASTPIIRCAVYTRKSSEEGLDQAFNSLDAQREAGVDYIKSQKHSGWTAISTHYDDGGYSGGSTDRPGLQKLLADIEQRRVDIVVVYKVDRLSRSLADFARLMQTFDEHGVSFVSVTQQFNTTTSMGRLTLNMLLSFAQFEREVTGERIRDKIAATKKKGVWISGQPPLGYRVPREGDPGYTGRDLVLQIHPPEAKLVRSIFNGYLELGSLIELAARLREQGCTTKCWTTARGTTYGGRPITSGYLYRILTNPVYIGMITHTRRGADVHGSNTDQTDVYQGQHEPIIDRQTWDRVHEQMAVAEKAARHRWTHTHLLKGKLRTFEDHAMSPGSVQRPVSKQKRVLDAVGDNAARLIRYYTSQKALKFGYKSCPIKSINAGHLDDLVRGLMLDYLTTQQNLDLRGQEPAVRDRQLRDIIRCVVVAPDKLTIELDRNQIADCAKAIEDIADASASSDAVPSCPFTPDVDDRGEHIILTLRIMIKRHDGKRLLISPDGHDLLTTISSDGRPAPRAHLVHAIGQAFAWHRELEKTGATIKAVAKRHGVAVSCVKHMLPLTQLSPQCLKAVLTGTLAPHIALKDLLAAASFLDWQRQHRHLGLTVPHEHDAATPHVAG